MKNFNLDNIRKILFFLSILLIIISVIVLIVNKAEIIELIFSTIVIGLSINIISSLTLIFLLDKRKEEIDKKELEKKQLLIVNNLITIIREFNGLIVNMYKATIEEPLKENDEIIENLYYNVDLLYNQINKIDLNKTGYICVAKNNKINTTPINWRACFFYKLKLYIEKIREIPFSCFLILDSELTEPINKILETKESIEGTIAILSYGNILNEYIYNEGRKENYTFFHTNFKTILVETGKICKYIDKLTNKKNFSISQSYFNNNNIMPRIGSGLINK